MINSAKIPEFVNSFLDYSITILNKSPNSVKEYNYDLNMFLKFMKIHFKLTKETENEEIKVELKKPKFLEGELPLSKAEIGTTVHLVMQKLDFKQNYTREKIEELLEELEQKGTIATKQKEAVPKQKILAFAQSQLFKEIGRAKKHIKNNHFI